MLIPAEKFATASIRSSPWGDKICQVLSTVMRSVDAGQFIRQCVSNNNGTLVIQDNKSDLAIYKRIFLLGAGKAVMPMAEAITDIIGRPFTDGLLITKDGYVGNSPFLDSMGVKVSEGSHPIPSQRNVSATRRMLSLLARPNPNDLVIVLISGGGSSLLIKPSAGVLLRDIQQITKLLLNCGASIDEINVVRKHLDRVKGGGLAKHLYPATLITLILSDVIGDNLDLIASGPTVADPSTFADAWSILLKYQLIDQVSQHIRSHISEGIAGSIPETLKPGGHHFENVHNFIVGSNHRAVITAARAAAEFGFNPILLPKQLIGESAIVGQSLIESIHTTASPNSKSSRPACYITGGETTVTVHGRGKGGRNQELALGAVKSMSGFDQMLLVSIATDGGDGPTDAAGAVATHLTLSRGLSLGLNPDDYLKNNDAYNYFYRLGDLIKIGPTLTNVNDLVLIFI